MSRGDRLREVADCLRGFPADDLINAPLAGWLDETANDASWISTGKAIKAANAILGGEGGDA